MAFPAFYEGALLFKEGALVDDSCCCDNGCINCGELGPLLGFEVTIAGIPVVDQYTFKDRTTGSPGSDPHWIRTIWAHVLNGTHRFVFGEFEGGEPCQTRNGDFVEAEQQRFGGYATAPPCGPAEGSPSTVYHAVIVNDFGGANQDIKTPDVRPSPPAIAVDSPIHIRVWMYGAQASTDPNIIGTSYSLIVENPCLPHVVSNAYNWRTGCHTGPGDVSGSWSITYTPLFTL